MPKFYNPKLSVTSGEVTPLLGARTDLAAYKNGAKELTNFIVLPQGGFTNRPGTEYIMEIKAGTTGPTSGARILPFIVNNELTYVVILNTDGTTQVYDPRGDDTYIAGYWLPLQEEAANGWEDEDIVEVLKDITYVQSVDIMLLFHRKLRPKMISRGLSATGGLTFNTTEFQMKYGPYQDVNSDMTIPVTMNTFGSGTWTLDAPDGFPIFESNTQGDLIYYEFYAPATSFLLDIADGAEWVRSPLYGNISMTTEGDWQGSLTLSRRGVTDTDYTVISSFNSGPIVNNTYPVWAYTGVEDEIGASYKINASVTKPTDGNTGVRIRIEASGGLANYNFIVTGYSARDGARAFVQVDNPAINDRVYVPPAASISWALGSFGPKKGYPAVACFHQERLVLANTTTEPTTIWMSKPADWNNFDTTYPSEDSDSIKVVLASQQVNEIRALSSREDLLVFTAGAEFVAQTGSQSDVFTPSSIVLVPTGYRGAARMNVLDVGNVTLFVQKHGNAIRSIGYQLDTDGYASSDLTVLSSHLFEQKRIKRWAYQQDPWSVVWVLLDDGTLLAFTFVQEHGVAAWSKMTYPWAIDDICMLPGSSEMIEAGTTNVPPQDDIFFLRGEQLLRMKQHIDIDGMYDATNYMDYGGGSPKCSFESLELEQEQMNGTVQGRFKQVTDATVRVYRTDGFRAGIMTENSSQLDAVLFSEVEEDYPSYGDGQFSKDVYFQTPGGRARHARLRLEHQSTNPITILGIWATVQMEEDQ